MGSAPLEVEFAHEALQRVLSSKTFANAERSSKLLRFLVESTLRGQVDRLKEYTLGAEALGRGESFDPRIDSIARVEVSRLRSRLEQYYSTEGREDPVGIVLPKGTYVPAFESRPIPPDLKLSASFLEGRIHRPLIWFASGGIAVACVLALVLWVPWRSEHAATKPLLQFDVRLAPGPVADTAVGADIALSPDGTSLVFRKYLDSGHVRLALRRLDQRAAIDLAGTEEARGPFFSPDGQWLAFWSAGKLKKIPLSGGSTITICDATDLLGGSWGEDDNIVAALDSSPRLWRVSANGGKPTPILDLTTETAVPRWPQVLPGAKEVLFTSMGGLGPDGGNIEVFSFQNGTRKILVRGGTYGRYLRTGALAYVNQATLYATGFDLKRLEVRGSAVAELQDVSYSSTWGYAQLDVSRDGTLVYRRDPGGGQLTLQWLNANGNAAPLLDKPGRYQFPRVSPNNQSLAFTITDSGSSNIFVAERDSNQVKPVTFGDGMHLHPAWSPDGRSIVYEGANGIWSVSVDATSKPQRLTESGNRQLPWSFTPDGRRLAFGEISPTTGFDLWTVAIQQGEDGLKAGKPEPFLVTPDFEIYPTFSPDGKWIAYGSNKSGQWEVCARAFPDGHSDLRISVDGGRVAYWPRNAHEIFYRTDDQKIIAVPYKVEGHSLRLGQPRQWSDKLLASTGVLPNFDVTSDGSRAVVLMPAWSQAEAPANEVTFLLNFADKVHTRTGARQ
jgi:eukaryotic-like serine/threonine-protein kinase